MCPCWDCISRRMYRRCHPKQSFYCQSTPPCDRFGRWHVGHTSGGPRVRGGIVSPAGIDRKRGKKTYCSAPDNHFTTRPDCRVQTSAKRRVAKAGSYPTICNGIVSAACGEIVKREAWFFAAPDNHFSAGPNGCAATSRFGRVDRSSGGPSVRAGIVSPAGVIAAVSTPDNHFSAGPHRPVTTSVRWTPFSDRPGILNTSGSIEYFRKCVVAARPCYRSLHLTCSH